MIGSRLPALRPEQGGADLSGDDERDQTVDMIADLLHLCDARGWEVAPILATANMHYDAEVEEEAAIRARRRKRH